eukprot:2497935-Rhodomonas_salina.1
MMSSITNPLSDYFLSSHKRVVQFAVGVRGGAAGAVRSVARLLPSPPPAPADADLLDEIDRSDPYVCLSLDTRNACNTMSRTAIFDAIYGFTSRPYYKGEVAPGAPINNQSHF